jgi:hypothetical protein
MTHLTRQRLRLLGTALAITAAWAAPALAKEKVDLLLRHGHVLTVDPSFSVRSAVAVRDGRIVAVGARNWRIATRPIARSIWPAAR